MKFSAIVLGCISLVLSSAIIIGVDRYDNFLRKSEISSPEEVFGIWRYSQRLTIESIDLPTAILRAKIHDVGTQQDISVEYELAADFYIERRDARIKDGIMIGTDKTEQVEPVDLAPGMRGIGVVHLLPEGGRMQMDYLVIGEPFPRP
jgi:hypothetical protein